MKKVYFILILLVIGGGAFAGMNQGYWRWRNDDGSETSATWSGAQTTAINYTSPTNVLRIRTEIYSTATGSQQALQLQYSTDNATWISIGAYNPTAAFNLAGSDSYVTDQAATTKQLPSSNATTYAGGVSMINTTSYYLVLSSKRTTEFEWFILGTASTLDNQTYYFRVANTGSSTNGNPSLTTSFTPLPVNLTGFSATGNSNKNIVQWSTASEQNCADFTVERSSDANTWSAIGTVKGNGTTSVAHNYSFIDAEPLNGINYYRIKQNDIDGQYYTSVTKQVNFKTTITAMASPNPAKGIISFKTNAGITNVQTLLTRVSGEIVHQQKFSSIQTNAINRLNMAAVEPGVYLLNIKSKEFSTIIKVIVE
ncbi:T9SS type A sorting domain-containing protein [Ferruginibacter albus]|uniref:T9SS type A sorting domain-containing protein n=1 Tax=Ferruginibacter albus TaxID=2875540 RepID=UPI001CC3F0AA|nr:T9SS type A sorting domain-containing protein [Ferruginibacter albus]UAY53604.1 T9SS type A sorting domain-containing protein [Ferruginibacter albus]